MSHERDDHGRKIPSWNGSPEHWDTYKDEVRIWQLGSPSTADYSLCARLVAHLKGPARRVGLGMTDEELQPTIIEGDREADPPTQRSVTHRPAIKKLLDRLQALAPQTHERRGQYLREFFSEGKFKRKSGERLAEWIPRWEEGVEKLRSDGVDFATVEDLPGFFLLEHSNLSEARLEMVRSNVPNGDEYKSAELKKALLRLFPHLHTGERRVFQTRRRQVYHTGNQPA